MTTTRSARRDARIVVGGDRHLAALKVSARRRNRRAVRQALRVGRDLGDVEIKVTGRDVS
jgi:hypothetical protein